MFNKNFYPTPDEVIAKMITKRECDGKILEPSAGKGNILDYIDSLSYSYSQKSNMYAIEVEPELQAILRDKEYRVLDTDFLNFKCDMSFDLIIMNPPFDQGEKHFLKAWEIGNDTEIRCLLNAESVRNPRTKDQVLIQKIIEDNECVVEYLGQCFRTSERPTGVDVVLIKIHKEATEDFSFEFNKHFDQETEYKIDDVNNTQIANPDVFGNLEIRYNKMRELFTKFISLGNEINYYTQGFVGHQCLIDNAPKIFTDNGKAALNSFTEDLRRDAWNSLFITTKLHSIVTTKVRKKFQKAQEEQGHMSFTAENMEKLFSDLFQNYGSIMTDCVSESFDIMTKYHKENRCHREGWVTNEKWFVNKKVILPNYLELYDRNASWRQYPNVNYNYSSELSDIQKGLCFITGKKIDQITTIQDVIGGVGSGAPSDQAKLEFGTWYDSTFFRFKCFKKATLHIEFKDENLWNKFNVTACKGKNWVGN